MSEPRKHYPSDLSDGEWAQIEAFIPAVKTGGRPAKYTRRELVNGIFYVLRTGGSWRMLPPWQSVYGYFRRWCQAGVWQARSRPITNPVATGDGSRSVSERGCHRQPERETH